VILNLLTVLPILGEEIVGFVLGSATVTSWSLRRFTALHFALAVVAVALIAIHIVLLHRQSPAFSSSDISDGSATLGDILAKDLAITLAFVGLITLDAIKTLVHPDNWNGFSRLLTPTHIEPEIYFL
jgi:quinol-cytochrome oxidoreductase complex cytochrome b subunit